METFTVAIDNGVEEWTPMDTEGWRKRLLTAKSITITLNGKRCIGDEEMITPHRSRGKAGRLVKRRSNGSFPTVQS